MSVCVDYREQRKLSSTTAFDAFVWNDRRNQRMYIQWELNKPSNRSTDSKVLTASSTTMYTAFATTSPPQVHLASACEWTDDCIPWCSTILVVPGLLRSLDDKSVDQGYPTTFNDAGLNNILEVIRLWQSPTIHKFCGSVSNSMTTLSPT